METVIPGMTVKTRVTDGTIVQNPESTSVYDADHCIGMVMESNQEFKTALVAVRMVSDGCPSCLYEELFETPCTLHRFFFPWDALSETSEVLPEQFDIDTLVSIINS